MTVAMSVSNCHSCVIFLPEDLSVLVQRCALHAGVDPAGIQSDTSSAVCRSTPQGFFAQSADMQLPDRKRFVAGPNLAHAMSLMTGEGRQERMRLGVPAGAGSRTVRSELV
jgi:hypothetical protein